jgi:hypothetical protein
MTLGDAPTPSDPSTLPALHAPGSPAQIQAKLETAARRGRLAGFKSTGAQTFICDAFGQPFESDLCADLSPDGASTRLAFRVKLRPMIPWAFAIGSALSVWPGVWLTDSLMLTYFPSFTARVPTWWWYLPLTVIPLPWLAISSMRKSRMTARASARDMIGKIAVELGVPKP